jgi:hypothetical protein
LKGKRPRIIGLKWLIFDIWVDHAAYTAEIAALRAELGDDAFTQSWETGRHLGLEGAIQETLRFKRGQPLESKSQGEAAR